MIQLEELTKTRDILSACQVKYYVEQYAKKILINSLYGALGSPYFRYYDLRNAEAVTANGQLVIQWGERAISDKLNQLLKTSGVDYGIYCDTDSTYVNIDPVVNKIKELHPNATIEELVNRVDDFSNKAIQPTIDKAYQELHEYMNTYKHLMFMDREIIASSAFWTAKKKYAAVVWDSEGDRLYDKSGHLTYKLKVMGLETQKSSTPPYAAKSLKKAIEVMLLQNESDLQDYVKKIKANYTSQPLDQIAQISSVNGFDKYINQSNWTPLKGAGQNHKAACSFNKLKQPHKEVEPIKSGDKIYILRLIQPNAIGEVFGWPAGTSIPKEFNLNLIDLVDTHMMLDKGFLSPLKIMTDAIGWQYEKKESLTNLFGI